MTELTLLLFRFGFLLALWLFVFGVVYSLRADLFGVRVRKLPVEASTPPARAQPTAAPAAPARPSSTAKSGGLATTATAHRIVITSGPKSGLEIPLGNEPLSIGRSSESGLVIRDDYTSSHHARIALRGETWMLQDLESTNGTSLGGERVRGAAVPITLNTAIKVGATTFELRA